MRFRRRPFALGLALALGLTGLGVMAVHAGASDPPVTLSPTSGQAGSTITVTLPSACKLPNRAGVTGGVDIYFSPIAGGPGSGYQTYPGNPGDKLRKVVFGVPAAAPSGHYTVSGDCIVQKPTGFVFVTYGKALFEVTGGTPLPRLKVSPTSGAAGTIVKVAGKCAPAPGEPYAVLDIVLFSATDPNTSVSSGVSGAGPTLRTTVTVPATFPPGSYFIAASCFDYENLTTFAEKPFTVTGPAAHGASFHVGRKTSR